ncbi:hypothetical protein TNCV_1181721 [Trichonephila clavipes]|nr:hypothetical protein TNCV_1181721 [Trichonephila clavipes]
MSKDTFEKDMGSKIKKTKKLLKISPDSRRKTSQGFLSYAYGILIPIFHIFSGLVVKKLPSSSVSPSGPPTEDRSDAPTHEALITPINTSEI